MSTPVDPADTPTSYDHDETVAIGKAARDDVSAGPTAMPLREKRVIYDGDQLESSDRASVMARERDEFGGMKFGAAFFGWLAATGLAVIVIAILAGAGVAFGLTNQNSINAAQNSTGTAKTVGLVGAIVLLVVLLVAYYCGGYVAGRMARFDGAKQGLAVWLWAIVITLIIALLGWIAGSQYNILAPLNLPRIPVDEGAVTTAGVIAAAAAILVALLGAVIGGIVGTRYHRRIDRAGFTTSRTTPN
jgi:hypothetical protein